MTSVRYLLARTAVSARLKVFPALVLFAVTGCTIAHIPKPDALESGAIPSLQGASSVSLVNAQDDATVRELGRAGFGTMTGDLRSWTQTAVALMKAELEKAGLATRADATKRLKVAIVEAQLGVSGIDFVAAIAKCRVRLRVETGNGLVQDDNYENHALAPPSACDKAVSQAVKAALSNEQIVAYLRQ